MVRRLVNEEQMMKEKRRSRTHLLQSHGAQMRGWKFLTWQENQKAGSFSLVDSSQDGTSACCNGALIFRHLLAWVK